MIPAEAQPYKQTREFTEHDMPAGLSSRHDTKPGVWGELVVLAGQLRFYDCSSEASELEPRELGVGRHGVIEPGAPHRVEPQPGTRFYVVFHRVPS